MKSKKKLNSKQAKRWFSLFRWLHIYVSSVLFGLLVFFCLTGITLNHPQWAGKQQVQVENFRIPDDVISKIRAKPQFPLPVWQDYVAQAFGLSNPRSVEIDLEVGEVAMDFPLPSGYAYLTLWLESGELELEHGYAGAVALLNDLHKGRHSGKAWKWLIDISSGLMLVFALTGLVILWQNAKHRKKALLSLVFGAFSPVLLFLIFVPSF